MSLNTLTVSGFIGNIEMTYTPNGKAMTKGYVKVSQGKNADGEWVHEFLNFVAWNDVAEVINAYNTDKLYKLTGKLDIRSYKDSDGNNRKFYGMTVFQCELDVLPTNNAAPTSTHAPTNRPTLGRKSYSNGPSYSIKAKSIPQTRIGGLEDEHPF